LYVLFSEVMPASSPEIAVITLKVDAGG